MRQSTHRQAPRPVRPAAAALSKMLSRAWSLPPQRNFVAIERDVQVPMSDGTVLLADHYLPIISQPAATVLVRCPYGRGAPAEDFVATCYSIQSPSALVVSQTAGKEAAHV
jgi:uncharacterized protein